VGDYDNIQHWCKNGHYWECDCAGEAGVCQFCGEEPVFSNSINLKNERIKEVLVRKVEKVCNKCGHKKPVGHIYVIPKRKGEESHREAHSKKEQLDLL